jgi:hypothetical protein
MIPDDEPWWMVRRLQGDGSVAAAESPARELSPGSQLADETEEPKDFRPFGYEW